MVSQIILEPADKAHLREFFKDLEKNLRIGGPDSFHMIRQQYAWMQGHYPGFALKEIEEICLLHKEYDFGPRFDELCSWLIQRARTFLQNETDS